MVSRMDKDERARRIIEHATVVFARKGYNATTIDDIAIKAKIAKGSVYQYFKSKQDLFLAVFDSYMQQYLNKIEAHTSEDAGSAAGQIRTAGRACFAMADEAFEFFPLVFEFWAASAAPEMRNRVAGLFRQMYALFREFFGSMIRRGIVRGEFRSDIDVDAVTAVLVGSLDGLFLQAWFDERMEPEKTGMAFLEIMLAGMAAPGRAAPSGDRHE